MIEFLLVHRDPNAVAIFKNLLGANPEYKLVASVTTGREAQYYISTNPVRVLILQLALPDMDPFELIQQLEEKYPGLVVVPVLEGNEQGEIWQRIVQLNLRDVVNGLYDQNMVNTMLTQAASRADQVELAPAENSYVITVASARGGVGKSVFATNLALSMVRRGAKTTLIDYSMRGGDFISMLDHVPRNTIADAVNQGEGLDVTLLRNLIATHPMGFDFLACPNSDFDHYGFSYEAAGALVDSSRSLSDYVVIDTGAYDLPCTAAAIDQCDVVFLLTTRDLNRLLAMQRFIAQTLESGAPPEKLKVIVNNAEVGIEISEQEIETVLEHPVTAYLPSNPAEITFSINSGRPLIDAKPELPFCGVIDKLAEYSMERWVESS